MYLSKCLLNTVRPLNPYELHRRIWKLFPVMPDANRDFLFRVENIGQKGPQVILLQSLTMPSSVNGDLPIIGTKSFEFSFAPQQILRFLVRANPTKRITDKNKLKNQGKVRVPLIDENEMKGWLQRQLDGGAHLQESMIARQDKIYFRKGKHTGKIVTATFSGILQVKEPDLFVQKIKKGIGPAKAFGCGLLSLARI